MLNFLVQHRTYKPENWLDLLVECQIKRQKIKYCRHIQLVFCIRQELTTNIHFKLKETVSVGRISRER